MSKRVNLTGKRFGKLLVLRQAPSKNKKTIWECCCSCGNIVRIDARRLKHGKCISCGCEKIPSSRKINLVGKRYGRLTVLKEVEKKNKKIMYLCKCDCGNTCIVQGNNLRSGHTKSCGCLKSEVLVEKATIHGKSDSRLYHIWEAMKQRCTNYKNSAYNNYGGRGVFICKDWLVFTNFRQWALMSGYSENLSIDRIDNNGGYEPSNCRWATIKEQDNNKRNNILLTFEGETKTLAQWGECKKIPYKVLYQRIKHLRWTVERALSTSPRRCKRRKSSKAK